MNIMIDLTGRKPKRYKINVCHYCNHDKYPNGKPIDPTTDHNAINTARGDWKCGTCVSMDAEEMLKLNNRRLNLI
jgi:hypothetical protein